MIETIMWSDQAATTLLGKQDLYCSVYAYHKMTRSQRYRKVCNVTTLFLQERVRLGCDCARCVWIAGAATA